MASDSAELRIASPSAQPLLHNHLTSDFDVSRAKSPRGQKDFSTVTERALEDGDSSDSDSDASLGPHPTFWGRCLMAVRRRRPSLPKVDYETGRLPAFEKRRRAWRAKKYVWRKRHGAWGCLGVVGFVVFFFGCVHIVNVSLGYLPLIRDDPAAVALDWTQPNQASTDMAAYLLDITKDVTPIPCHSHNDYWRRVPLYDALRWGCTGVEADVWLFDEDLFVGHSTHSLTKNRTFTSMYVDPLTKMLDSKNENTTFLSPSELNSTAKAGVFDTAPQQTLVLLVDFKNNGSQIWPYVSSQLATLREKGYLTYFDGTTTHEGPITVVATGNAPFDLAVANSTYRDIFFDAPLDRLYVEPASSDEGQDQAQYDDSNSTAPASVSTSTSTSGQGTVGTTPESHFDSTNSFYASTNFKKSVGRIWWGHLSSKQRELIRGQIKGAHERGLKVRYWGAPKWPIALRNRVWWDLVGMGVDYLNGDDLVGMTKFNWSVHRHWGWFE